MFFHIKNMEKHALIINLFGGPGTGKSTIAAELFSKMKWLKKEVELVTEYAKDLVWEDRFKTIKNQIYVFGKQHNRVFRLLDKVDFIITDSPILLSTFYNFKQDQPSLPLAKLILDEHNKMNTLNIFLKRIKDYNPNGRYQTETEANEYANEIEWFLIDTLGNGNFFIMDADENTTNKIIDIIQNK